MDYLFLCSWGSPPTNVKKITCLFLGVRTAVDAGLMGPHGVKYLGWYLFCDAEDQFLEGYKNRALKKIHSR
jgi:hypothetical protein